MRKYIIVLAFLLSSTWVFSQMTNHQSKNSLEFWLGYGIEAGDSDMVYPTVIYKRDLGYFQIGLMTGFRHSVSNILYGRTLSRPGARSTILDHDNNELYQHGIYDGYKKLRFGDSRFFQIFGHLYLGKEIKFKNLRLNMAVAPGIEKLDVIAPSEFRTLFTNDGTYDTYLISYRRIIALGLNYRLEALYHFRRYDLGIGVEYSNYKKGSEVRGINAGIRIPIF